MNLWVRIALTIMIALLIGLSLLLFAREECPSGQQWVLSDNIWVCK
jgi:hypothetical protein